MQLPQQVSYVRHLTMAWIGYGLFWMSVEGAMGWVLGMGFGSTAVLTLHLYQRTNKPDWVPAYQGVLGFAFAGVGVTAVGILLSLMFMVVKTGLHGHGPEFTPQQIRWLIGQWPIWTVAGGVAGAGMGLIVVGAKK